MGKYNKLIMAVLQGDDYPEVVRDLNENGFYVTLLNSTGGFLKKKSMTIMVGVEEEKIEHVLKILKTHAGGRMEMTYQPSGVGMVSVPVQVQKGGIIYFIMDISQSGKF